VIAEVAGDLLLQVMLVARSRALLVRVVLAAAPQLRRH